MSKNSSSSSSLNTEEALILGNPPDDLFNPSMSSSDLSSSLLSTDRFDPIKNYPSISSLEIDSENHSHQAMEDQRGGRDERELQFMGSWNLKVKGSSSIKKGKSAIKRRLSNRKKKEMIGNRKKKEMIGNRKKKEMIGNRKKKEMMDPSLYLTPLVPKDKKIKSSFGTPQSKRLDYRDREWDRDRDFELMPPPGTHKKSVPATSDVDHPIDPNEPTYCVCHQVSFGDMIACDMDNCQGGEWFHCSCVGLTLETRFKGKWYCPTCKLLPFIMSKATALESEQLESK